MIIPDVFFLGTKVEVGCGEIVNEVGCAGDGKDKDVGTNVDGVGLCNSESENAS